jgi:hypothetical protein
MQIVIHPGSDVNILKKIAKKICSFLTQNKAIFCLILIITLVFEKTPIFCQKLSKIVENCDRNIDPRIQSYEHELQRQRCEYFTTNSLVHKKLFSYASQAD